MNEKLLQIAAEAEAALLGCAIREPGAFIGRQLRGEYFFNPNHYRLIEFAQLNAESNLGDCGRAVMAEAIKMGLKHSEIAEIASKACMGHDLDYFYSELVRARQAQNLGLLAGRIWDEINGDPQVEPIELLNKLEMEMIAIRAAVAKQPLMTMSEVSRQMLDEHWEQLKTGTAGSVKTGFRVIDTQTGGMFPGQLWQIAARPYMGKTALGLNIATNVGRYAGVHVVSLEMSNVELAERIYAASTLIGMHKFSQRELSEFDLRLIEDRAERVNRLKIEYSNGASMTVQAIRANVKLHKMHSDVAIVLVDHLQLIETNERRLPRHEQLKNITRDLKVMARELDVCVLLLSQLNISAEGNKPTNRDYAGSKDVLADLDVSILMHRETPTEPEVNLDITKNRRGKPFECVLTFNGELQSFSEPKAEFEEWIG